MRSHRLRHVHYETVRIPSPCCWAVADKLAASVDEPEHKQKELEMKKLIATVVLTTVSAAVLAFGLDGVKQSVPLKDGSTVHVFENGKMAMEDKFGRAMSMSEGEVMETSDGQKITMRGNEVARLDALLKQDYQN